MLKLCLPKEASMGTSGKTAGSACGEEQRARMGD